MITLRPYQQRCVDALYGKSGIVKVPAGGGKTIIAAAALAKFAEEFDSFIHARKAKAVWIANTYDQIQQAQDACALFPILESKCSIEFACYAAIPDLSQEDIVIWDECHHCASPEYRKCFENIAPGTLRWGFSATPHRADELAGDVYKLIGPVLETVHRDELIEAGNLAEARVMFHAPCASGEIQDEVEEKAAPLIRQRLRFWRNVSEEDVRKRTVWTLVQKLGVFESAKRNARIVEIAGKHTNDSLLILVGSIEHGELIAKGIPGAIVVFSKMGLKKRSAALDGFKDGSIKCIIATSLADEGLDVPRANVLILAAGGRSAAKAEQRTGRVLRSWEEKTHGTIHDFYDHHHYFLKAQSKARLSLYKSLGYAIQYNQEDAAK